MIKGLAGFDWDASNWAKCQKHGVSIEAIEEVFSSSLLIVPDATHSKTETRMRALGKIGSGRMIFLIFTVRVKAGLRLIRPISARYMHAKEVAHYEKENPQL